MQPHRAWYQPLLVRSLGMDAAGAFLCRHLASVIFLVGFGGGIGAMYQAISGKAPAATPSIQATAPAEASISGITSIQRDPNTNQVKVQYTRSCLSR